MAVICGCGGNSQAPQSNAAAPTAALPTSTPTNSPPPPPPAPHVALVVLENQNYDSIVDTPAMPYLNSLIAQGGLATNYYADTHTSLPNYFMLTTGALVTTTNSYSGTVTADNIVRQLLAAHKTWKSYAQGLPTVGYTGGDTGFYVKHHNPFAFISDVINDPQQVNNMVPLTQLATDIAAAQLPNYLFIVPDNVHNSHDCPNPTTTCTTADKLTVADQWLSTNIAPLLASADFRANGVLVITFDESVLSDSAHGGGHVATVLVGTGVHSGYRGTKFYQHESVLRLMLNYLNVTSYPGAAASAPDMNEFFQ